MTTIEVMPISAAQAMPWILLRHYARRKCSISFAFGAYRGADLIGVVTYGTPASAPLRTGLAGDRWAPHVLELNRLCCENSPNVASRLVGRSLALLPKPSLVVSFADLSVGHVGYVYQACNFIYTGLSALRSDWSVRGEEHLHGATIADRSRGQPDRAAWMRQQYGDRFYLRPRSRKHRYVYLCGDRRQIRAMKRDLRYSVEAYPKGDTQAHAAITVVHPQGRLIFATEENR